MRTRIPVVASLLVVLAAGFAYGQSSPIVMKVNVPFKFIAGEKEMPAGEYTIMKERNSTHLTVYAAGSKTTKNLFVITHLAQTDPKQSAGAKLVFGTVGDQKFLSEVWLSGTEDGYLVHAQNGKHGQDIEAGLGKLAAHPILRAGTGQPQGQEASR